MEGTAALDFCRLIEPLYEQHGFEPMLTLSTITDRALGAVMTIAYDKESADETARAQSLREKLAEALATNGYISYRASIDAMGELGRGSEVFWDVASDLKNALDPLGIIAPGRYDPSRARG
jgi:4-cresol dehydrogenase (hydroxylating)